MLRQIRSKIQNKLILTFTLFCVVIFSVVGFLNYWYTESGLDEELGKKLLAVAQAAHLQVNSELVSKLRRGDENSRTYRNFRKKLADLRDATDVERIYICNSKGESLLDTDEGVRITYAYPFLKFNQFEFDRALKGLTAHSILFETYDGKLYKTAFVPLFYKGEVIAVVGVQGSATFLYLIKRIQWFLFSVGAIGVLISILLSVYISRSMSTPINHLVEAAEKIGAGKLETPIKLETRDEIGFLGRTMEKMRSNILKRDQDIKTMVAGVAHELRNPLGGVELFAHLLNKEIPEDDSRKKYAGKIIGELDVMKKIITDFLDFARPRTPQPELCDLKKLVDETLQLLGAEIESKSIIFKTRFDVNEIFADAGHIRQVLLNLIENAIQSVDHHGEILLTSVAESKRVCIVLADNGSGIDVEHRDKIFEPFFTTKEKGSGLGLAIVKKIIDENHGEISVESLVPQGVRFTMKFSRREEDFYEV